MTFLEHLDELRRRILYSIVAVAGTFVVAWVFHTAIFRFLEAPILGVVDKLVVIKPTDPFTIYLKVSFTAAIFLAIPFILFQIWLFVAPGLYRKEKRYVLPFLLSSTVLFVLGGMFAYYIVLPPALDFLLNQFGIVAAVVSPTTDPFNLFLWSGPMVILYVVSIAVSWIFKRRRDQRKTALD
ncbi:MAG: twin-arginine translocase subunit TatC [Acidobacteriota bacterium]